MIMKIRITQQWELKWLWCRPYASTIVFLY